MKITEISIEMVVDGRRRVGTFLRQDKIDALLDDNGSIGEFLRDLAVAPANIDGDQQGEN